jgi:hypothetical protein
VVATAAVAADAASSTEEVNGSDDAFAGDAATIDLDSLYFPTLVKSPVTWMCHITMMTEGRGRGRGDIPLVKLS